MDRETDRYWFAAKRYGWGWGLPRRWEGWVAMAVFYAVVVADGVLFAGREWVVFGLLIAVATAGMVGVCWWKGEPARWRWGE